MQNLLDFLRKHFNWVVFLFLEGVSLSLLFQFNHQQNQIWLTTANSVVATVNEWEQSIIDYIRLGAINERLTTKNILLEQQNAFLRRKLELLQHDSTYQERKIALQFDTCRLLPARIINNTIVHKDNFITLNVGAADGVKPEMGVICGKGIVGIVYMVSKHYCLVMSMLNSRSRISCRLRNTNYFGTLTWDGKHPLYAILDDLPLHSKCKVGDIIETSGFSSVFPAGLYIGRIASIQDSKDGQSYRAKIHLGNDLAIVQDVCVIQQDFQQEIKELETFQTEKNN